MADDNIQPIIVKKIKKGGHGRHGGAWKIAYADFVTAMMAFFLLMWLLGSTTQEQKQAISDYFNNPSPIAGPGGASTSLIKIGGGKDVTRTDGEVKKGSNKDEKPKEIEPAPKDDKQRLLELKQELEDMIDASAALKPFKDQLLLEITKEGLRIQIIDKENRPMFNSGSSVMQSYALQILREIGAVINHVPNKISLSGHTDATPYANFSGVYSNWELSADRANASRRALIGGGMDEDKVARVVGLSSAVLFDKENPYNPINRRISIIVLNKETADAILHDEGKLAEETTLETPPPAAAPPAAPPVLDVKPAPAAAPPVSAIPPPVAIAPVAPALQPVTPAAAAPLPAKPAAAPTPVPKPAPAPATANRSAPDSAALAAAAAASAAAAAASKH